VAERERDRGRPADSPAAGDEPWLPAYHAETDGLLRARLPLTAALFLLFVGAAVLLEIAADPRRRAAAALWYGLEALTCLIAILVCRAAPARRVALPISVLLLAALAVQMDGYQASVGGSAPRLAMADVTLLMGGAVLMPWGPWAQLVVAGATVAGFVATLPALATADNGAFTLLALLSGTVVSVCSAHYLDRYRRQAFIDRRDLEEARAREQEEAEITVALLRMTQALGAHLDAPNLLEEVNRMVAAELGCDWCRTRILDEERQAFVLAATVGSPPELAHRLGQLELPLGRLPFLEALRPGEVIEIADVDAQTLLPPDVLRQIGIASSLTTLITRGTRTIGYLAVGYRERRGPFTPRQRRLLLGIAGALAVTLEHARLIAELQAASRLKSEFVSTMSHELRTPLNVISGYTDLLLDGSFGALTPPQRDTLERIRRGGVELLELVNATLDLGRLETGRERVTLEPVALEALFAELARELEPLAAPGVTVRWAPPLGSGSVLTDRAKLKTILKNLASNALKFTSTGTVTVTAAEGPESTMTFTVQDTGIGIAAADLPVIFEMFRQADGSTTRRFGGVGLGLHIVKRLVDLLGGTIAVESTPGVGSTFTVTLEMPRLPAAHAAG
jgi:signal transduction histidine kinase